MRGILSDIDEIEKSPKGEYDNTRHFANQAGQQHTGHVLPLFARNLGHGYNTILEVADTICRGKSAEAGI